MPKVSIIVPLYNEEKYIRRCIQSILDLTYKDYELILIDDGSNDDSFAICEEYVEIYKNVYAYKINRGGVSRARNYGLDRAKGEYIWFVDGDDSVYPDSLEQLVKGMEESGCDLVIGKYKSNRNDFQSDKVGIQSIEEFCVDFCCSEGFYYDVLWNKLYKRKIITYGSLKFDENITFAEDCLFNCDYLFFCNKVKYINQEVYYYSDENSYNKSLDISLEKETMIINAFSEMLKRKRKLIKKNSIEKEVEFEVNRKFFNLVHKENKLLKQYGFNELLINIWNSEEFISILKIGSGVRGKNAFVAKVARFVNLFWIYRIIL